MLANLKHKNREGTAFVKLAFFFTWKSCAFYSSPLPPLQSFLESTPIKFSPFQKSPLLQKESLFRVTNDLHASKSNGPFPVLSTQPLHTLTQLITPSIVKSSHLSNHQTPLGFLFTHQTLFPILLAAPFPLFNLYISGLPLLNPQMQKRCSLSALWPKPLIWSHRIQYICRCLPSSCSGSQRSPSCSPLSSSSQRLMNISNGPSPRQGSLITSRLGPSQ